MKKTSQFGLGALERFATSFHADFRFAPINIMVLLAICLAGLVVHAADPWRNKEFALMYWMRLPRLNRRGLLT